MKRVVIVSDFHCGHRVGLTPPKFQNNPQFEEEYLDTQNKIWNFYSKELKKIQPINTLIVNGDAIEGKGERSGGTELGTSDLEKQCEAAVLCIKEAKADKILMLRGTPAHTGKEQDWENVIAKELGCKIYEAFTAVVEGTRVFFDVRHFVSTSTVPYARNTPLSKAALDNTLRAEAEYADKAEIVIRSHAHYYTYCSGPLGQHCVITPALQGPGSKYGSRICSGTVNVGFVWFDIRGKNGDHDFHPVLMEMKNLKPKTVVI